MAADGNTASGSQALYTDTHGSLNTASGFQALYSNVAALGNTASGYQALYTNDQSGAGTAVYNTASGYQALYFNTTGDKNTAIGAGALYDNQAGNNNIGVGYNSGMYVTGSYNIEIGSAGTSSDANTIRIGTQGAQTAAFVAGIYLAQTSNTSTAAVVVDSTGNLGTISSSRRYKQDIQPMADASDRLLKLRPVQFRYKKANADGAKPIQYGLIAEEVQVVLPELVMLNKDGQPETVAYHLLPAMLLNELQKEHATITAQSQHARSQDATIAYQAAEIRGLKQQLAELSDLKQEMRAALRELKSKEQLVAQR